MVPAASRVHGFMQALQSVLLLLLASLKERGGGAIAEGLWVNGWASYHGTGSHCFRAPGIWVLFTEVTEKAARAQGA